MRTTRGLGIVLVTALALGGAALGANTAGAAPSSPAEAAGSLRVATFNASLNRNAAGQLVTDLSTGSNAQAQATAAWRAAPRSSSSGTRTATRPTVTPSRARSSS